VYFVYRRLLYALSITYIGDCSGAQLMLQILLSLMHLSYVASILPFEETLDNNLEIFNESSILLVLTCNLAFVTVADNVSASFNFGYIIIGLILFNILVNVVMFLATNARVIYLKAIKPLLTKCSTARKAPEQKKDQKKTP
jgi:hypothetical protein